MGPDSELGVSALAAQLDQSTSAYSQQIAQPEQ
jgi:hypothetical protein